ncbi:MAG TPA: ATP-binding protein [Oscillospiraceae bacterium]|nr:ATP-binding protein [Oscillospiraceae bacterium]
MELFDKYFDRKKIGTPFLTFEEQMGDCLRLVDLYLGFAALAEAGEDGEPSLFHLPGTAVRPEQASVSLEFSCIPNDDLRLKPEFRREIEDAWGYLESRIGDSCEGLPNPLSWVFTNLFRDHFRRLCVLLGAAVLADRKYEQIFSRMQGNPAETLPTLSLAYGLSALAETPSLRDCLIFPRSGYRWDLFFVSSGRGLSASFLLRESVFHAFLGSRMPDAFLSEFTELFDCRRDGDGLEPVLIREDLLDRICAVCSAASDREYPVLAVLSGEESSGRHFLIRHAARRLGLDLLFIDLAAADALSPADFRAACFAAAAACSINGFVPVLCHGDIPPAEKTEEFLSVLAEFGFLFVFMITGHVPSLPENGEFSPVFFPVERLTPLEAETLWNAYAGGLLKKEDPSVLSARYRMTPGQIRNAVRTARFENEDGPLAVKDIAAVIRSSDVRAGTQHCSKVKPFYTLGDIILPDSVRLQVLHIIDRINKQYVVNSEWGFGKKYAYGKGVSILFYGSPGTGKTMCAHVIAHALGLDLLKVDLSSIFSKYVGETEKNLTEVFREAESTNAILFFDEADSLFSQRSTEMNGANDKYANLETNHLLQKMEEFSGICILTTNMMMNFDKAFYRRIEYMVNIPFPDPATRLLLWKNAFPPECPLSEGIPFEYLAEDLEYSPSQIKTAARGAAYLAAYDGAEKITAFYIAEAIRLDFAKNGKVMPRLRLM